MSHQSPHSPVSESRKRHKKGPNKGVWVLVALAAGALVAMALVQWEEVRHLADAQLLWAKLVRPLIRTLVFISVGLLVGQLLEGLGLSRRLGRLFSPLICRAHLPLEAGAAFAAAFASGITANTLLYTSWQEGKLDRRQLILANILNASLPAYVLHLPTTFFVVYALLGKAALVYFGLTFLAAVLRSLAVIILSRWLLAPACPENAAPEVSSRPWAQVWPETWKKFRTRLKRLLIIILPVYVLVFLLAQSGFFAWLGSALAKVVSVGFLPLEAMSVVVFAVVAEFTSGFAAAGALLDSGALVMKQAVLALLAGNVVATPVRALRHQLPHYLGIYSPKLGAQLLAIGQGARVLSVIAVGIAYALIF